MVVFFPHREFKNKAERVRRICGQWKRTVESGARRKGQQNRLKYLENLLVFTLLQLRLLEKEVVTLFGKINRKHNHLNSHEKDFSK